MSAQITVPVLREFLEAGGTVLAIGDSTVLGSLLNLPLADALVDVLPDGRTRRLPSTQFYIPGSILAARVDNQSPLGYGLPEQVDFVFDSSPAFRIVDSAASAGVRGVAWYDLEAPLRSGWAWGQERLQGAHAVIEASVGKGRLVLYGPEILFRAQPHGTFKLLFNGIFAGHARPARP
jgi:hypothetical protein